MIKPEMKTVIMAGGKGTRISAAFPNIPKPLIPITDSMGITKPILEWEIEALRDQGFTDIIITVSHMADKIIDYFGDGNKFGVHIDYFVEETPLGNAGALIKLKPQLGSKPFLLLNADALFEIDFHRMAAFHYSHGGLVTLFTHPNSHPFDSGLIMTDASGSVTEWLSKEDQRPEWYKNRVNAGLHIIDPQIIDMMVSKTGLDPETVGTEDQDGKTIKIDLDRQLLKPLCGTGKMFAYDSPEYVKDMGTPERYEQVCRDFQCGTVSAKNLSKPQKAIFLDRDGTINKYVGFLRRPEEFELNDGAAEAIRLINSSDYLAIVITNQPVIARGEVTVSELETIHNKMETELGKTGAYIDGLYYCPHHPDKGYPGEVKELKIECNCRKPKPGMLLLASSDYNIDLSASWMIGDGENDIRCGKTAGCKTALIGEKRFGQDMSFRNILEAVQIIISP